MTRLADLAGKPWVPTPATRRALMEARDEMRAVAAGNRLAPPCNRHTIRDASGRFAPGARRLRERWNRIALAVVCLSAGILLGLAL